VLCGEAFIYTELSFTGRNRIMSAKVLKVAVVAVGSTIGKEDEDNFSKRVNMTVITRFL
jgi:hypothetical protein